MNEQPDPLEAELASLRPQAPSPTLQQRLANQLDQVIRPAPRWKRNFAVAAGVAAACLVATLIFQLTRPRNIEIVQPVAPKQSMQVTQSVVKSNGSLPALRAFSPALTQSPAELESLLDKHAVLATRSVSETVPIRAFSLSRLELSP